MKEGRLDSRDAVIQGGEEGRGMASSLNHHTFDLILLKQKIEMAVVRAKARSVEET